MNHVGIDVSCKELVVVVLVKGKERSPKTFDNTAEGHQEVIQYLSKFQGETRVCLEATGVYHFDITVALSRAAGIEVMVINPKTAHNFAKVLSKRSKTDAIDAQILAYYCEKMAFEPWQRPANEVITLRVIARRISALNKQRTQAKNQLHALESTVDTPQVVLEEAQRLIDFFTQQIELLRQSALDTIKAHPELAEAFDLIISVKGIAEASAIQILAELMILPSDMSAKQWVAHAGLDPRHYESGSSVSKKTRISKVGNKFIRHSLYMPALVAVRYDAHIKGYYNHLIQDNGLKKMQALCAVMRKLLHALYGMLKNKEAFDGSRLFKLPA